MYTYSTHSRDVRDHHCIRDRHHFRDHHHFRECQEGLGRS